MVMVITHAHCCATFPTAYSVPLSLAEWKHVAFSILICVTLGPQAFWIFPLKRQNFLPKTFAEKDSGCGHHDSLAFAGLLFAFMVFTVYRCSLDLVLNGKHRGVHTAGTF